MSKRIVVAGKRGPDVGHIYRCDMSQWENITKTEPRWCGAVARVMAWVVIGLLSAMAFIQLERWVTR